MRLAAFSIFTALGMAQTPALDALIKQADQALRTPASSVMDKEATPPSGDKHDYMSVGPYWWPDPSNPDGLLYIRKDGETNPSRVDDRTDNVDPAKQWPFEQIGGVKMSNRMDIAVLLRRAALAYKDPRYEAMLAKLPANDLQANRMQILWPASRIEPAQQR
jgi:hypothetical protein